MTAGHDAARWQVHATVEKWSPDQTARALEVASTEHLTGEQMRALAGDPVETVEVDGNMLLTAGLTRLVSLMVGGGGQALDGLATRLGAGNSSAPEAVGQTDLQAAPGAANRFFQPMDATFPQVAANVATFKATFGPADGNFVWSEWGTDVGAPTVVGGTNVNAVLFNRRVAALGEKVAGATWTLTTTITIS